MAYYSIPNIFLDVTEVDFSKNISQIIPKEHIEQEDIEAVLISANKEQVIVKDINDAKAIVILLSRLCPFDYLSYTSSPIIVAYSGNTDFSKHPQKIDISLLANYPNFKTLKFYLFEDIKSEEKYARQICADITKNEDLSKIKYTKQIIAADQKPEEVIYLNAFGEFCRMSLKPAAVQLKKLQLA